MGMRLHAWPPRTVPLNTICGDGKTHVPAVPPFGMQLGTRSVVSGLRWPGQGSWLGSSGMLLRGSRISEDLRAVSGFLDGAALGSLMRWP